MAINNKHWILLAAKRVLLFFCVQFLLISTKYLINLFIYSTFFGELFSADPAFQIRYSNIIAQSNVIRVL